MYLFILYTLLGSVFILFSIVYLYTYTGSTNILIYIFFFNFTSLNQKIIFVCLFIGLSIKIPMFPFYIWLPEAHVEAPTVGSVILASLLLKLGAYGIYRVILPILPLASYYFSPIIYTLSVLSIIYSSFSAIRQLDVKRIIAYSSIAHMNLGVIGIFSFNYYGLDGSLFLMVAHGITSAGLFFLVGFIYDRYNTRLISYYGGLSQVMPKFSFFLFIFTLSNMAFPLTCNFIGEFVTLVGIFYSNIFITVLSSLGIILSSVYSI
jgi:proton-translocating NADH-quinone oxidoreductase chain M